MKKEVVDDDEKLNIGIERGEKDRTINDLQKDYPRKTEKLAEVSTNFVSENDPKILKTELPDKWKYLNEKLA